MKKLFVLVLVMAFVLVFAGLSAADCDCYIYDNWQGDFFNINPTVEDDYVEAGGRAIVNFDKDQNQYMVNIQVYGLKPGESYGAYIQHGTYGYLDYREKIGYFEVGDNGRGRLIVHVGPDNFEMEGISVRLIIWERPGSWVLNTSDNYYDSLQPRGSARVKCDYCED